MTYFLPCPACNQSLYLPSNSLEDDLEVICQFCQSKYSATYGTTLESLSVLNPPPFELAIETESEKLDFFCLNKSKVKMLCINQGEKLILLSGVRRQPRISNSFADWLISLFPLPYTVKPKTSLVAMVKRSTGDVFELSSPVKSSPISLFFSCTTATPIFSLLLFPTNPFSLISLVLSRLQ